MPGPRCAIAELKAETLTPAQVAQIDAVFFEASGRTFSSDADREGFRERWLGRFLQGGSDVVLVALDAQQRVVGYLVGVLEDPAQQARFDDIAYFHGDFRDLCRSYPAHLHINLAPSSRSQGVGPQLIDRFAARARDAGAPGMHVVTGKQSRNVSFYTRCGFAPLESSVWNGREIVFLARRLQG